MFCNYCRDEFEKGENHTKLSRIENLCHACRKLIYSSNPKDYRLKGRDLYCVECGDVLEKYKRKCKSGEDYFTSALRKRCSLCTPIAPDRFCVICNAKIEGHGHKYCDACNIPKNKITHKDRVILAKKHRRWLCPNEIKIQASFLTKRNPHDVTIVYECRCDVENKVMHHFDYNCPYDVLLLCRSCHRAEHRRLDILKLANLGG